MSVKNHVILNHVDSPLRILFWTKGEILLFLGPFLTGIVIDEFTLGLVISCLNAWVYKSYKKRFGKGKLQAVMYWYLPRSKQLKELPHSFVREYLG
jgi:type IV conjugative transfer system protein TraL